MKSKQKLGNVMPKLDEGMKDAVFAAAKAEGKDVDELELRRSGYSEKATTAADIPQLGPRESVQYVSTRTLDRDKEIILPKTMDLKEFMKYAQVLVNHNYSLLPVATDLSIKADDFGIKAHSRFADTGEGTLANVVWNLVQQGVLKASSVGFVPLAWTQPGHADFEKIIAKLTSAFPEFGKIADMVGRIITKSFMLEHSFVSVPAEPNSEIIAVAKGLTSDTGLLKDLGFSGDMLAPVDPLDLLITPVDTGAFAGEDDKAAIPYKKTGIAPKDADWDGPKEVAAADTKDLLIMSAWYNPEASDMKGSYKLPHHTSEAHTLVWRGLTAAMGALLGARGGVTLPQGEVQAVYDHLAKHYRDDFDSEPPELRSYVQGDLKSIFPDLFEPQPPVRIIQLASKDAAVRIIKQAPPPVITRETVAASVKQMLDIKRGRL